MLLVTLAWRGNLHCSAVRVADGGVGKEGSLRELSRAGDFVLLMWGRHVTTAPVHFQVDAETLTLTSLLPLEWICPVVGYTDSNVIMKRRSLL